MSTLLYHVVSAFVAGLVLFVWLSPQRLRFLLDKGTEFPSLGRQGQYTALLVSTWGFVTLILSDKLTEFYFVGYIATWTTAQGISALLKIKGQQAGAEK